MAQPSFRTIADNNRNVRCTECGKPCQSHLECERNQREAKTPKPPVEVTITAKGVRYVFITEEGQPKVRVIENENGYVIGSGLYTRQAARDWYSALLRNGGEITNRRSL